MPTGGSIVDGAQMSKNAGAPVDPAEQVSLLETQSKTVKAQPEISPEAPALVMMSSADGKQLLRAASSIKGGAVHTEISRNMQSTKKQPVPFLAFLMIGCAQLLGWNILLNGLPEVLSTVFNVGDYADTVTATYSTVLFVLTVIFTKVNVASLTTMYLGLVLSFIVSLGLALICQYSTPSASSAWMHSIAALLAVSAATVGSSAFGFAAIFPANYSGAASAGLGVAGVVSFVVWMIGSQGIFGTGSVQSVRNAMWLLCGVGCLFSIGALVLAVYLFSLKEVKQLLAASKEGKAGTGSQVMGQPQEGTYEKEGVRGVLIRGAALAVGYFFTLYISLVCFPIIGPLNFSPKGVGRDVLMGVFQVGDLIGRYAPNYLAFLRIRNRNVLLIATAARVLFVLFFVLSSRLPDAAVLGSYWFLVLELLFLSLSNGWFCTLYFLKMPEQVEGDEAKVRIASFCLLAGFVGIAGGQWTGKGIVSIP